MKLFDCANSMYIEYSVRAHLALQLMWSTGFKSS